jgi:uncharacterized membrane protein
MVSVENQYQSLAREYISNFNSSIISDLVAELVDSHFFRFIFTTIMILIIFPITPICLVVIIYETSSSANIFTSISCWQMYCVSRTSLILESIFHLFLDFYLTEENPFSKFINTFQSCCSQSTTIVGYC